MKKQRLEQKQYQNLSPQQIQFLGILQLPVVSLEKRIEEELEENPALEEQDQLEEKTSVYIGSTSKSVVEELEIEDKNESLENNLTRQLIDLNLEENILFLVNYLINSLDEQGFLSRSLYSISSDLLTNNEMDVPEKDLQLAMKILRNLDPVGVGAENLQHSILIQLQKKHPNEKIAYEIISKFYTAFSNKNYEHLIKKLLISKEKLKSIYDLIEGLNPFPSAGFSKNITSAKFIYADFAITTNNNQLELQIKKGNTKTLKVSKYYSDLLLKTDDDKTKDFLTQKIEKAKWFKESMEKREITLKKVMGAIMQLQKKYLITGNEEDLKPMRLADVADIVNMDISTISRVSNSKFIEAQFGTFKVKDLFSDAFRKDNGEVISTKEIKRQLKEIIRTEDKTNPFTDEKIAELLGREEYHISRRTVAKYRKKLKIETAKLRRTL